MMGWIVLAIIVAIEVGMMGYSILQKKNIKTERAVIRVGVFVVAVLAAIIGVIEWNFRVVAIYLVLLLLAIYSIIILIKQVRGVLKIKEYTNAKTIRPTDRMRVKQLNTLGRMKTDRKRFQKNMRQEMLP